VVLPVPCSNPDVQAKAAKELRLYVESEAREMNSESFTKYMNDLNRRIFDLVNSSDTHEKMGGIMVIGTLPLLPFLLPSLSLSLLSLPLPVFAVSGSSIPWPLPCAAAADELIDVPYEENETKIIRFANYLRMVFNQSSDSTDPRLLERASKALGTHPSIHPFFTTTFLLPLIPFPACHPPTCRPAPQVTWPVPAH
jgi:FKBP12-rapamycin complex-associated protein